MIKLGPLELSDSLSAALGVAEGDYRRLAGGEERTISQPKNTLRFQFRQESWKSGELLEMVRNNQIHALPLHTGHGYLSGNYVVRSLRETPMNPEFSNYELVVEYVGRYLRKLQDIMVREDDWVVLINESFEDASNPWIAFPKFRALHDAGNHTFIRASNDDVVAISGINVWKAACTDKKLASIFGTHWRNYEYSAWVQADQNEKHGIIWRAEEGNIEAWTNSLSHSVSEFVNSGKHYRLVVDTTNNKYIVEYHTAWGSGDSVDEIYTDDQASLVKDVWYHLKVICMGDFHFCFVNGQLIHYFEDARSKGHMVGTIMDTSTIGHKLYVDDVLVREIPYAPIVLDESYHEPSMDPIKTRNTTKGTIGYFDRSDISYQSKVGNGCVLHYRFDQPYGDKVMDLSGNENHGDVRGAEWHEEGFIRMNKNQSTGAVDGTYIKIPHDASLDTPDEGTLVIRMRVHTIHSTSAYIQRLIYKGEGTWSVTIEQGNRTLSFCIDKANGCTTSGSWTADDFDIPSNEFATFVVRWNKTTSRQDIYKDGLLAGGSYPTWTSDGAATTDPMLIGNANVDIEYMILYDKFIEYPELPDSFGVKLMDVDSHHKHEIFDIRWNHEVAYVREYWNDLPITISGVKHVDDLASMNLMPMLYRRGGAAYSSTNNFASVNLPDHIAENLHEADWTIEMAYAGFNNVGATTWDIFSITDTTGATQTIGIQFVQDVGLRCVVVTDSGTDTIDFYDVNYYQHINWRSYIVHVVYKRDSHQLVFYVNGIQVHIESLSGTTISDILDTIYIGKRNATGSGLQFQQMYRHRIMASALNKYEVEEIVHEYSKPPIQVFDQHEFKGYPELSNGILKMYAFPNVTEASYGEFGERAAFEIYDEGSWVRPQGDSGGTNEPIDIFYAIADETNEYVLRSLDHPIVSRVSQDSVIVEQRNQFRRRDPYFSAQGLYVSQRVELSIGAFAIDMEAIVETRCLGWGMYLSHTDMQVLWREGGYILYNEDTGSDIWNTFISCNGAGAAAKTITGDPSTPEFKNYTIMANWDNQDYMIGILSDPLHNFKADIEADADVLEDVYFDSMHVSNKLRTVIAMTPVDSSTLYHTEQGFTPSVFANTAKASAIDNDVFRALTTASDASAVKSISFDPGIYRLLFDFVFTETADFLLKVYGDPSGYYSCLRRQQIATGAVKTEQMWFDLDLVVNGSGAQSLKAELFSLGNATDTRDFDGLFILPLWNGADYILDQLYMARLLKQTRRLR